MKPYIVTIATASSNTKMEVIARSTCDAIVIAAKNLNVAIGGTGISISGRPA